MLAPEIATAAMMHAAPIREQVVDMADLGV
jgi:hypothetical protein